MCLSAFFVFFFSSSSWQHLRIHDVVSSPRILQHHAVRNKGSICSSSYLGIITVCDVFPSLWFLVALDYCSYFFLVCPFSCIQLSNLNYFQLAFDKRTDKSFLLETTLFSRPEYWFIVTVYTCWAHLNKKTLKMMRPAMEALFLLANMCKGEITDVV